MSVTTITAYLDSAGVVHRTIEDANTAENLLSEQKVVDAVKGILQRANRNLGRRETPSTLEELSVVVIAAYPALKTYYGD